MKFDPGIEVLCEEGVYEPAEDSRLLIEAISVLPGDRVHEVGCGTGIIALHCAKAGAKVTASDISAEAVGCAKANALRNHLQLEATVGDMLEGISGPFDLIVFNPPYLSRGPADDRRWTGGESGIEAALRFLEQCKTRLAGGGKVMTVVSSLSGPKQFEQAAERIGYRHNIAARRRQFFEELTVYELAMAPEG
jgi:release factor glutamine methyltransferase